MSDTTHRRLALVTGASGGIGLAIAERFAADGVDLVLVARSRDVLEREAARLAAAHGIGATAIAADLAKPDAGSALADALDERGLVPDYLVNNAGSGLHGLFVDTPLDVELDMMALNMTTPTVLTKRLLPGLIARRGRILNIASTAAFTAGGPYMAVYFATKAYLLSLSEALAEELDGSGVTVTAYCPGATRTGFGARAAAQHVPAFRAGDMADGREVGRAAHAAMMRGDRVVVHGLKNRLRVLAIRFAPRRVVTAMVRRATAPA